MRKTLKGVPIWLFLLVSVLVASPLVAAWIVTTGPIANVSLSINKAAASWEPIEIALGDNGDVDSGAPFSGKGTTVLTIANAEMLYVSFDVITATDEEKKSIVWMDVTIGEDTNGDDEIDDPWGTISIETIEWEPIVVELGSGTYNVVILVEGVAGYPEVESPVVDFQVIATVETPTDG